MANFPAHLSPVEAAIITNVLDAAFAKGYEIMVHDECEPATIWTCARASIEAAIAATDLTSIFFRNPGERKRLGWVTFVHGNEEDVISDCADNEATDALLLAAAVA